MAPNMTYTLNASDFATDPGASRQQLVKSLQGRSLCIPDLQAFLGHWPQYINPDFERLRQDVDQTLRNLFPEGGRLRKMRLADAALFGASWWPYAPFEQLRMATYLSIWVCKEMIPVSLKPKPQLNSSQLFAWDNGEVCIPE